MDQRVPSNDIFAAEHIDDTHGCSSSKRLKISDINISRYEQEFVEIKEIASGTFGTVKVARHRLDGMVYAIKVTIRKLKKKKQTVRDNPAYFSLIYYRFSRKNIIHTLE